MTSVVLDGRSLTIEEVVAVARERAAVELAPEALERMRETRALVERVLERGDAVYGMTTGVGARKKIAVPAEEARAFNRALVVNHLVGAGPDAPEEIVRATMVRARERPRERDRRAPGPRSPNASSPASTRASTRACGCWGRSARPISPPWPTWRTGSSPTSSCRPRRRSR